MRDVVINPAAGGKGGKPFELYKPDKPVKSIDIWSNNGEGGASNYIVLKGLAINWDDGSEFRGQKKGPRTHFTFDQEHVRGMNICAAPSGSEGRCDSIDFTLEHNEELFIGGEGGHKNTEQVGNGVLVGFVGAAQGDIDRLGAVFQK
ncbi:predicted protein [Uncinocarpus reesii 1704]|uniref:Jacalin-type lectin domain-containing protein n=1 Tax=Uncinocarpus reesii (strain UAMH 1704) TaxID=336963 RepID=C4JNK3_UNCRE|nr:uncharacterized protein UREG_03001 [Uncinocarpus reesii 1704]EEP78156.1 predicted protein [Uncinocarpus reesii 1704]